MLLYVGITNHSKSSESPLTPQLCCSHVISFPGRTSMSTELGVGGEEGAARGPNATDYHGFYPKFSLWNILTSQIVFSEFWGSWFVMVASFIVLCVCVCVFFKDLPNASLCSSHESLPGCVLFFDVISFFLVVESLESLGFIPYLPKSTFWTHFGFAFESSMRGIMPGALQVPSKCLLHLWSEKWLTDGVIHLNTGCGLIQTWLWVSSTVFHLIDP